VLCRECLCENTHRGGLELCARCGALLGTSDLMWRVRRKVSQLARFGLAGPSGRLLTRDE
jgi:hypothetical protein